MDPAGRGNRETGMERCRTLILPDDDADDRTFISDALREIDPNIVCLTACDGRDAIEKLEHCTDLPDYIFLDINMPVMDGKECLQQLKKHERLKNIPVVIYTTSNDPFEMSLYYSLGARCFLQKPNSYKKLLASLREFLDGNQQAQWRAFIF